MLPCTCGHSDFEHDTDDGSCATCGCAAFVVEGSHCEPLSAGEVERGVTTADRGCRSTDAAQARTGSM
ncbi:MAG: hypothetical protein ACRD03_09585 [Acidimicrobiales bacterium]